MKRTFLGTSALVAIALGGTTAWAQTAQTGIETVTVTAEKRAESAQNVGIALTVVTSDDLVKHGIDQINGLAYATPSLEIVPAFGSGQPEFRLRGVGFDDYGSNNSSTVGVYIDGVAYPIPSQTQGVFFDIARTEVLYGPQGTLYGINTTGGAVSFITNKPTDFFTAGITEQYDSHNESITNGYVSGPIADGLDFRLAGITDQGGAWQKNIQTGQSLGDKNTSAVRGELQWEANSDWKFLLEAHYGYDKSEPNGLYLFAPIAANNPFNPTHAAIPAYSNTTETDWGGSIEFAGLTGIAPNAKPFHNSDNDGVDLTANGNLGFAELTSITSYDELHRREYNDWDASSLALAGTYFDTEARVFSQELRLASNDDGPFTWVGGLYYAHQSLDEDFDSDFWQSLGFVTQTTYNQHVDTAAIFGQTEYQFTDQLKLVTGLRAEDEQRKQDDYVTAGVFGPNAIPFPFGPEADKSLRNKRLSGKGELEYKPTEAVLLYASVSEGVKSGGFTAYNVGNASAVPPVKPEVLWAYEAGFKSTFFDNTLQLNGAGFYYHYEDEQVQSAIASPAGPIGAIVNAPKAHLYGGELEAEWQPDSAWRIAQSVGWKGGEFDKYLFLDPNTGVFINDRGRSEGFPPWSYNGSVSYLWTFPGYGLEFETDYAYHDHQDPLLLQQLADGPTYNVKAYWLANANVTLTPDNGPWSVAIFAHNFFNTKYDLTRNFFLTGIDIAQRGEPATVGLRVSLKY